MTKAKRLRSRFHSAQMPEQWQRAKSLQCAICASTLFLSMYMSMCILKSEGNKKDTSYGNDSLNQNLPIVLGPIGPKEPTGKDFPK